MVDLLLQENKQLLQLLQLHHHHRLLSKDKSITLQEIKTAHMVVDNLQALVNWVKPELFKKGMDIQDFIFKSVDGKEGIFRGTLMPGSLKAIHSNQVGPKTFNLA
jgi:hypothetical protein